MLDTPGFRWRSAVVALTCLVTGCGLAMGGGGWTREARPGGPAEAGLPQPAEADLEWVHVAGEGFGVRVRAPAGAVVQRFGDVATLSFGRSFGLAVRSGALDLVERRWLAEQDRRHAVVEFHADTDEVLVYETQPTAEGEPSAFHFVALMPVDGRVYTCENVKGWRHTLAEVEAMLRACKSMEPVPQVAEPPSRKSGRKAARSRSR